MDNFHFIDIKPSIDRKETVSIRDAIFKRAKEKAQAITEEKSENYSTQVQNDVMEIARDDIKSSSLNPFNQFMENVGIANIGKPQTKPETKSELALGSTEVEQTKELKHNIESVSNQSYTNSVKDETMTLARKQFQTNLSVSLTFLNTQAAINMAKNTHSKIR